MNIEYSDLFNSYNDLKIKASSVCNEDVVKFISDGLGNKITVFTDFHIYGTSFEKKEAYFLYKKINNVLLSSDNDLLNIFSNIGEVQDNTVLNTRRVLSLLNLN